MLLFEIMKKFLVLICSVVFFILLAGVYCPAFSAQTVKFESEIKEGLVMPLDVAVNASGQLIVFDGGKNIFAFDNEGKKQLSFPITNDSVPIEGAVAAGSMADLPDSRLVIVKSDNSSAQVFNLVGESIFTFGVEGSLSGQFKTLSAVEVDPLGFIYVADGGNKRVQIFTPNGIFSKEISLLGDPADVAVDRRGNIYALLPDVGKIEKFSNDGKKIGEIICKVNNKDQIRKSSRLQIDVWGNIYLTQLKEERIVRIDQSGNVLIAFGSQGSGRGQFSQISGVALDESGRVYVADSGNARVQIFKVTSLPETPMVPITSLPLFLDFESTLDAQESISDIFSLPGKGLFSVSDKSNHVALWKEKSLVIGKEGTGPGELSKPSALYVTLDSRIFVADSANHRVQIFNYDGTLNYEFGKNGDKPGQFNLPQGIVVNGKGMIFVADTLNNRIEVFNQDGIYLNAIGQEEAGADDKAIESCQMLNLPKVLAVDSKDQIYVVDADTTQVKVFDENGGCLASIKSTESYRFKKIVDVAIDQNDNIYVADAANGRVLIFDSKRKFLLAFGSLGTGRGYFKQLSAVAASEGYVFVVDYQSNRIQIFKYSPDGLIGKTERFNTTRTAPPAPNTDNNEVLRYTMARNAAFNEATKEFIDSLGFSKDYLLRFVRIDSIESLNDGNIKVTISIPKFIPREIKPGG